MHRFRLRHILVLILPLVMAWLSAYLSGASLEKGVIGPLHIAMGVSIILSLLALFYHYWESPFYWLVIVVIPIIYAVLASLVLSSKSSLIVQVIPNLILAIGNLALLKYVFYDKTMFRMRTILISIGGAILLSVYLAMVYILQGMKLPEGFWSSTMISSLFIYVFIGFGLSFADLIVIRGDVKELRKDGESDPQDDN
ncbi:MAG TPA: hypothetical protein PL188_03365 [Candidatus Cloacimonadota bacterium]|nr:hypothetical protein [Candidatus Cloacimonadota bacterium]